MDNFSRQVNHLELKLNQLQADMSDKEARLDDIEVNMKKVSLEDPSSLSSSSAATGDHHIEWPVARVRETFIKYFQEKHGHTFWMSSPVVPVNDPTLLFANAGMNQFKPLFLGTCDPAQEMASLKRAVNSQKCIRAGGKHNDLEDVGKDVYHHTFFEMLGNWSFGDYFKEEAIKWSWDCLVNVYGLNPDRLYATYFGGDESQGIPRDDTARELWLQLLPPERVLPFGCKDNFWEMGPVGPCGPCTEIHYDRIGNRDAAHLVNADVADVMEIWNLVFIQYNRESETVLKTLPAQHVDTGMGLERLTSILQDKPSNYDTDVFMPIFARIQEVVGCRAYSGKVGAEDTDLVDMAYRVVADHIRTLTFAIADGCVPSSDGRGYVLRRILRRAVRYGQEILNAPSGFFTQLVSIVVSNFSEAFPNILTKQDFIMGVIEEEESSFNRTLDQGVKHFKKVVASLKAAGKTVVPGKDAHILFTSMGFPLDLTELMAAENGLTVDGEEFQALMDNDRRISEEAEAARKGGGSKDLSMAAEQTSWLEGKSIEATDASHKYVWHQNPTATVRAIYTGRGAGSNSDVDAGFVSSVTHSEGYFGVILDRSSFYYESGGQIYDTGSIVAFPGTDKEVTLEVSNCQVYKGYVVHVCEIKGNSSPNFVLTVGDVVECRVDYDRRSLVAPNHTMTHVLNYAIRKVLIGDVGGDAISAKGTCDQKGSLVDADKLRFDFSWNGSLKANEIKEIESIVSNIIDQKVPVFAQEVPLADAAKICSLRSVFGERYPDPVRVLSVGADVNALVANPENVEWKGHSVEFCGGTHLSNTAEAEAFAIVEESGIAKGVRRITALTRVAATQAKSLADDIRFRIRHMKDLPAGPELNAMTKSMRLEVDRAVVSLVDKEELKSELAEVGERLKAWQKSNQAVRTETALALADTLGAAAVETSQNVIVQCIDIGTDGKVAKKIQDKFKALCPNTSVFLCSADDDSARIALYTIATADHVAAGLDAKKWCEECITALGAGKGGGKSTQATANIPIEGTGKSSDEAIEAVLHTAKSFAERVGL